MHNQNGALLKIKRNSNKNGLSLLRVNRLDSSVKCPILLVITVIIANNARIRGFLQIYWDK